MVKLDLDGIKFEFRVDDYRKCDVNIWDDTWCNVYVRLYTEDLMINYKSDGETLLCCEVEALYECLGKLIDGSMKENTLVTNIEPDFTFTLHPSEDRKYYMDWEFALWHEGGLTSSTIHTLFDSIDIKELYEYLKTVIEGS